MKTLIIGSNGYIGSSLFIFLKNYGFDVEGVDLCQFGYDLGISKKIDYNLLSTNYLSNFKNIILLAGNSSVGSCRNNFIHSFKNNIENFLLLLNKLSVQKFIYASSSSVYGNTNNAIADENTLCFKPISTYDLTKQIIDYYIQLANLKEFYSLRFGTVNGYGYSNVVRQDIMINCMVKNAIENKIIKCINPEVNRPILCINDLCKAILLILLNKNNYSGIYNLSSFNTTVGEVSSMVAKNLNCDIETKIDNSQKIYDFKISSNKFLQTYNYKFTGTVQGIISSLVNNYKEILFTDRNLPFLYV